MQEIEIIEITQAGNVLTSNGELMVDLNYDEVIQVLGKLEYKGDYQDLDFYTTENPIRISASKIYTGIVLEKGLLTSLNLSLDDSEINKTTSSIDKDIDKIKAVKKATEILIQQITLKLGRKVKGMKYYRKFENGYVDLRHPTTKWPHISISFQKADTLR